MAGASASGATRFNIQLTYLHKIEHKNLCVCFYLDTITKKQTTGFFFSVQHLYLPKDKWGSALSEIKRDKNKDQCALQYALYATASYTLGL